MRTMEEIMRVIEITGEFNMIQCLYNITVTLEDDDKLIIKPGVECPEYFSALNDPLLVINPDGEVVIVHEDDDTRWVEHFHGIYPPHMFVKVNPHDWNDFSYSETNATAVRNYVLELAKMWAEYNA